ncbi:MAG: peptide chain release factor N(5)-glutamine methyltransferase [Muribaculaceae bacterium]|nr:peptide chain release factor N(5)-glutamine methyltransferase [Muribaculaceae bacterium]
MTVSDRYRRLRTELRGLLGKRAKQTDIAVGAATPGGNERAGAPVRDAESLDYEAIEMARLIFYALKGWNTTDLVIHAADEVSDFTEGRISEVLGRMKKGEPIQYVLGECRFYGLTLAVRPGVLIPRQETEELVEMIVDANTGRRDLRVLDVGTGSGAIALALARNLEFPDVTALDVSREALSVAEENARRLRADIRFIEADIFTWQPAEGSFDIIVSNPPYVMESEEKGMEAHVLDWEPRQALFVPDSDPLRYYRRIAEIGTKALVPGGRIYFEINPLCADGMVAMMEKAGYTGVEVEKDICGKRRFVLGIRN